MKGLKKRGKVKREKVVSPGNISTLECEIINGLKEFSYREIVTQFRNKVKILRDDDPEAVSCEYIGDLRAWLQLRTVVAVYLCHTFAVPRPKALLGHQNFQLLLQQIERVRALHPSEAFQTFRISAAGENSAVFSRIKEEIGNSTQLALDPEGGDLLLRVRPARFREGWDLLTRISPRPLVTRPWRVFNMPGALNATLAAAMVELTQPQAEDRFLNIMCGSGTLLVERLLRGSAQQAIGCDLNPAALAGARENLAAGGVERFVQLFRMDATRMEFPDHSFNVIASDLPWGQLVGSHEENRDLYPRILAETARVAEPGGRFALLTHDVRLFEKSLGQHPVLWQLKEEVKIKQGDLHPRIYLLQRSP